MSELKPCPFCGESKLLYSGGCGFRYDDDDNQIRLFRVHCRTCKGRTGLFESLDEAVEAWNRRTNSTTIQPSALSTNLAEVGTDCISRQAAIDAARDWYEGLICGSFKGLEKRLRALPPAQPETAKRIVGKSRDGITLWYQCDMCNEPVDVQDNYCRGCGRRLIDE